MVIRQATKEDTEGIARVHIDSWISTYKGIINESYLKSRSLDEYIKKWKQKLSESNNRTICLCVEVNLQIVGFVHAGPIINSVQDFRGEVYTLYLLDSAQKKGYGKELFSRAVFFLQNLKLSPIVVWVLKDNPSRSFYTHLGGSFMKSIQTKIGDQNLTEDAIIF